VRTTASFLLLNVPVSTQGDVWARYIVRMDEMRESVKICLQALDGMSGGPLNAGAPTPV
jgi:NADH-quinone oxidoreductase subunit D